MLSATNPFCFILFGASGNLAKLKIYPALYVLALKDRLPEEYAILGFARSDMTDDSFRSMVREAIQTDMEEVNESVLTELLSHTYYHQGAYDDSHSFASLQKRLTDIEKGWQDSVRVAYLSVPPSVFTDVLEHLCGAKISGGNFRCIVEKPVGHDLKSFEEIHSSLIACFKEDQIFLLDHYLGKEAVRNIYYLRFANPVLERVLKNTLIHHVEIVASETLGLEGRAGYFDQTGTFLDFFQSHLLQISSLLTMRLQPDEALFPESRFNALEQFYLPPAGNLDDIVLQGQYAKGKISEHAVPGYLDEEGIDKKSRTNTFVTLKLMSRISRWQGVPFYLKSGKRMDKRETRISIVFQEPYPVGPGATPNRLDIILQGEAGMRLHLQTKVGGTEPNFRPLVMEDPLVCYGDCLPEHGLLLFEAINGYRQWLLTFDEVRASWRLVDPVQAYLTKASTPLHSYAAGSQGPKEMHDWIRQDGIEWL